MKRTLLRHIQVGLLFLAMGCGADLADQSTGAQSTDPGQQAPAGGFEAQSCDGTCCNVVCGNNILYKARLQCGTCTNWATGVCSQRGKIKYGPWWNNQC